MAECGWPGRADEMIEERELDMTRMVNCYVMNGRSLKFKARKTRS
jgi:hypothetical protein